ncbi:N-acetylmuramic acid 6-phosphate etherase [Rhizoctonia solani AG-1 IB]|uniref:N-acetyl-D-glucosamine kinase n=1 Tax=Thanatephorus cucumeris (strain AG1-IB / isolate 7/3/14) TaxID=1108050 RepID=M5C936_THACB|nr:N-acetylmuramic acid 6-phosphate etherase [Rhizoctonia solani AG-1 IB]
MSSEKPLFLCLDCGGSKTAAVLVDNSGNVVGRGTGGPSNFMDVGMNAFLRSVKTAVQAALEEAVGSKTALPLSSPIMSAAWFGISGCDRPADAVALQLPLSELLTIPVPRLVIANDSHLLASPLSSHPDAKSAIVVIGGTGSNCVSFKRKDGQAGLEELSRSGGWGWILGDEGSGFDVGRTAVRHVLTRWDQTSLHLVSEGISIYSFRAVAPRTDGLAKAPLDITNELHPETKKPTLRAHIFKHFGISSPPDLFSVVYTADPPPLPPIGGASANAPPPSPGPTTIEVPTTPTVVVEAAIVDGVTGTANLSPPTPNDTRSAPAKPPTPTPNPNIHLLERKHRLTSLTPLIFSSAFDDGDPDALSVLRACARKLAEHINNLMVPFDGSTTAGPKAVRPEETLLCFGGSLVGIKKYRLLVVDELARLRRGLGVGTGEAEDKGQEGTGVVAGVVFVGDAALSGAVGLISGFAG